MGRDDLLLKLSTLMSTIIIQEKDPWNFTYSLAPLVAYLFIGAAFRLLKRRRIVVYDRRQLLTAFLLLLAGSYFFMAGLEEEQDYLRLNHAAWHIFGSGVGYFCINAVKVT